MAFVYRCFAQAAKQLNVKNTALGTGGCIHAWEAVNPEMKSSIPQVGPVGIPDLWSWSWAHVLVYKVEDRFFYKLRGIVITMVLQMENR